MLLSKEVEVEVKQKNTYLEKIGYFIPKEKKQLWFQGKKNGSKYIIPKDTKILVKVEDLSKGSNTIVQVQCDNCGKIYEALTGSPISGSDVPEPVLAAYLAVGE